MAYIHTATHHSVPPTAAEGSPPTGAAVIALREAVDTLADHLTNTEQGGAGQPATRPESKSDSSDKPQPESEGRSR